MMTAKLHIYFYFHHPNGWKIVPLAAIPPIWVAKGQQKMRNFVPLLLQS
jgi:hypothetical protein